MAVEVLPVYDVKGYYRLALAQQALGKYELALRAANKGLALQPSTQLSTTSSSWSGRRPSRLQLRSRLHATRPN